MGEFEIARIVIASKQSGPERAGVFEEILLKTLLSRPEIGQKKSPGLAQMDDSPFVEDGILEVRVHFFGARFDQPCCVDQCHNWRQQAAGEKAAVLRPADESKEPRLLVWREIFRVKGKTWAIGVFLTLSFWSIRRRFGGVFTTRRH